MPLIGYHKTCSCDPDFVHPNGNGVDTDCVNMDHYARKCPNPPHSVILAEALYKDWLDHQVRYGDPDSVSATKLTRDPLHAWMEDNVDFVEDPLDRRFMLRGTMAHKGLLDQLNSPRFVTEQQMMYTLPSGGRLYGTFDAFDLWSNRLIDLKTSSPWRIDKFEKMKPETILDDRFVKDNVFQINTYKVMIEETLGFEVEEGELQYWDGDLRVVRVDTPLVKKDIMLKLVHDKGEAMMDYLSRDSCDDIPCKEDLADILSARWHVMKKSGAWFRIKEELERRG